MRRPEELADRVLQLREQVRSAPDPQATAWLLGQIAALAWALRLHNDPEPHPASLPADQMIELHERDQFTLILTPTLEPVSLKGHYLLGWPQVITPPYPQPPFSALVRRVELKAFQPVLEYRLSHDRATHERSA